MHLIMLNQDALDQGMAKAVPSLPWWYLARGVVLLNGVVPPLPSLSVLIYYLFHHYYHHPSFILLLSYSYPPKKEREKKLPPEGHDRG